MADISIPEYRVSVEQLRPGVFIRLERTNWFDHPFLFNSFKIRDEEQIVLLRELGVTEVICIPEKSDRLPYSTAEANSRAQSVQDPAKAMSRMWEIKKNRTRKLQEKKERIAACEKRYASSAKSVEALIRDAAATREHVGDDAARFAANLTTHFLSDSESTLHLMNVLPPEEVIYSHALNVAVLSLMLGQKAGLAEQDMRTLALSALFHDLGKERIDRKVLRKRGVLNKAEQEVIQRHPAMGAEMLRILPGFSEQMVEVVLEHHERMDGGGYPKGLKGSDISVLARILTVANAYDNLCNHPDPAESLTPYLALSYMFTHQKRHYDKDLLALFIRCLGVYPPGTVVQLSNGAIGMVMSVNPEYQLCPSLVIYDPEIPRKEALIVDLVDEPELKVEKSIRLGHLPREILEYLSPRTRITYFLD